LQTSNLGISNRYNDVPEEFKTDPDLYYALQASLLQDNEAPLAGWDQGDIGVAAAVNVSKQETPSTGNSNLS
jgi:hypothetical protein